MPANPTGCCVVATECCAKVLPDIMKATFTNVASCPAIDGLEITLYRTTGAWTGSATCGGEPINLVLKCNVPMEVGGDCNNLELDYDLSCGIDALSVPPDPSCSCDPLNLVYTASGVASAGCGCCNENETVEVTITITA